MKITKKCCVESMKEKICLNINDTYLYNVMYNVILKLHYKFYTSRSYIRQYILNVYLNINNLQSKSYF